MTRATLCTTAVVGILMILSATAMRFELGAPGISSMFERFAGSNAGQVFQSLVVVHGLSATVFQLLVAAFACFVARDLGNETSWVFAWLSVAAAVCAALLLGLALFLSAQQQFGASENIGWTLYPPLSTETTSERLGGLLGYLEAWGSTTGFATISLADLPIVKDGPAAMILFAACALVGTRPGYRLGATFCQVFVLVQLVFALVDTTRLVANPIYLIGTMPLLVILMIQLTDDDTPSAPYLSAGVVLSLGVLLVTGFGSQATSQALDNDTQLPVAVAHGLQGGMVVFVLFAALNQWLRPRISYTALWAHGLAIATIMGLNAFSHIQLAKQGMPRRYIDYPDTFAALNLGISTAYVLLGVLVLGGLIAMRRRRA